MRITFTLLASILLLTFSLQAQKGPQAQRPSISSVAIESDPVVDGEVINDIIWKEIAPITSLTQVTPNYGMPVSEQTHIRLAYTNKTLYVVVVCFDQTPEALVVSDSRRDANLNDDDSFLFIFDT